MNAGLNVIALEDDQALQDDVLSVYHAMITTLNSTPAIKIIENDRGVAFISGTQQFLTVGPPGH